MRNLKQLSEAISLLHSGAPPYKITAAFKTTDDHVIPLSRKVDEYQQRRRLENQLIDERYDLGDTDNDIDIFEQLREEELLNGINRPRRVSLTTPPQELTGPELRARKATRAIIDNKLMQLGLGALATGSTTAVINNIQGDDEDANIIFNPVTSTAIATGLGVGGGGLIGYHLNNAPTKQMAVEMVNDRKRGSGSGYERDAAFERDYGKKYNRKVKQRAIRGGLRGASIGAGGAALLQLIDALGNGNA